jgi:hypothetical protein
MNGVTANTGMYGCFWGNFLFATQMIMSGQVSGMTCYSIKGLVLECNIGCGPFTRLVQ